MSSWNNSNKRYKSRLISLTSPLTLGYNESPLEFVFKRRQTQTRIRRGVLGRSSPPTLTLVSWGRRRFRTEHYKEEGRWDESRATRGVPTMERRSLECLVGPLDLPFTQIPQRGPYRRTEERGVRSCFRGSSERSEIRIYYGYRQNSDLDHSKLSTFLSLRFRPGRSCYQG